MIARKVFKKLLAHSSVDEAAIGELFFELDGNLDGFITEKESRCWRIEKTLPKRESHRSGARDCSAAPFFPDVELRFRARGEHGGDSS